MGNKIQAIRGMKDIFPDQIMVWQEIENILRKLAWQYGYQELRFPILEKTELFKRCIGSATDIVEKEMYSFITGNGESLTLRPEGTAGCVRAGIDRGLLYNQIQRWWYLGPMFRHERPQKGRYRQFYQFGVEVFGLEGGYIDAELILMSARLWRQLGLLDQLSLQINSLGSAQTRIIYKKNLLSYFSRHLEALDEDSQRRLKTNPLRILDSKNPKMRALLEKAPNMLNFLDESSLKDFTILKEILESAHIQFEVNPHLVRGLDYYNKMVFEWVDVNLTQSAQNTVCAGGRYDNLVELLGGASVPAVGFAIGLDRLVGMVLELGPSNPMVPHIYFITVGETARKEGLIFSEYLRSFFPELNLIFDAKGGSLKTQLKYADKSNALFALILGDEELKSHRIIIKDLRKKKPQECVMQDQVVQLLQSYLKKSE